MGINLLSVMKLYDPVPVMVHYDGDIPVSLCFPVHPHVFRHSLSGKLARQPGGRPVKITGEAAAFI